MRPMVEVKMELSLMSTLRSTCRRCLNNIAQSVDAIGAMNFCCMSCQGAQYLYVVKQYSRHKAGSLDTVLRRLQAVLIETASFQSTYWRIWRIISSGRPCSLGILVSIA